MASTKDKEWSNHKWTTRERDKNGKWRYDYDMKRERKNKNLNKYGKELLDGIGELVYNYKDFYNANGRIKISDAERKTTNAGRKFIE